MSVGSTVRGMFGRHERAVANAYRAMFMSLDDYGAHLCARIPHAGRILEIGCGEGAVTEILARIYPGAEILAIDIARTIGRMYEGRRTGVAFRQTTVQKVAEEFPGAFDLVTLSDVLHHIPEELRTEVLTAAERTVAPAGVFLLKDWARRATPIHALCHAGDRYLTGDRVAYLTPAEARALASQAFSRLRPGPSGQVKPWSNNYTQIYTC